MAPVSLTAGASAPSATGAAAFTGSVVEAGSACYAGASASFTSVNAPVVVVVVAVVEAAAPASAPVVGAGTSVQMMATPGDPDSLRLAVPSFSEKGRRKEKSVVSSTASP